jgi:5'-nucleotidase
VVSGINKGGNMGDDITYSGTVSAAMEATLMGVPAFAVSLASSSFEAEDFAVAAGFSCSLARRICERSLPPDTLLNINVPSGMPVGIALTRQGKRNYSDVVVTNTDPRGRRYYWLGGGDPGFADIPGTDFHAVHGGSISVTPLHLDLTNYRSFDNLAGWQLEELFFSAFNEGDCK